MVLAAYPLENSLINNDFTRIDYRFLRLVRFANRVNVLELGVEDGVHLVGVGLDLVHFENRV